MAYNHQRLSTMSSMTGSLPRQGNGQSINMSTQTLINAVNTAYKSGQPYPLEASTSLVVNTWQIAMQVGADGRYGGTNDQEIGRKAWEHARRRAEDGCIVLGSLHDSTPSMIAPMVSSIPVQAPTSFYTALEVVKALTHCVTPKNPSLARYSALSAKLDISMGDGHLVSASLALSKSGIDTRSGLLDIPSESGYRAFDALYYLVTSSSSQKEKERLGLEPYSSYHLLKKSNTFMPPSYVPTADDAAAAEDFRNNLRAIGIVKKDLVNFICVLAGLLKLGNAADYFVSADERDTICDAVALLLDIPEALVQKQVNDSTIEVFIAGVYEALVDWVIEHANVAINHEIRTGQPIGSDNGMDTPPTPLADDDETVSIHIVSIPNIQLGKAVALRNVFDDSEGINCEMKEDGVEMDAPGSSVLREMQEAVKAVEPDLGIMTNASGRQREQQLDEREGVLESIAQSISELDDCWLSQILHPVSGQGVVLGTHGRFDLSQIVASSRVWLQLCLHPTDDDPAVFANGKELWQAGTVSGQCRSWRLPEWANRRTRNLDYTADFSFEEFTERYAPLGCRGDSRDMIEAWALERGWSNGEVVVGKERVWMRESAWAELENTLEVLANQPQVDSRSKSPGAMSGMQLPMAGYPVTHPYPEGSVFGTPAEEISQENLLARNQSFAANNKSRLTVTSRSATMQQGGGDYGLGSKGDTYKGEIKYDGGEDGRNIKEVPQTFTRRLWVALVWVLTFWIPSPALSLLGRMKRPDVRLAWREKLVLVFLILLLNGLIVFYIIEFGRLLCPNFDKAWLTREVAFHQGEQDYWVSHAGYVYDLTKFYRQQHSDTNIEVTSDLMMPFAGTDVTGLIRPPLNIACSGLVKDDTLTITPNQTTTIANNPLAIHTSGKMQTDPTSALYQQNWYPDKFLPKMKEYFKGDLVWSKNDIKNQGQNDRRMWFRLGNDVYDLSDYYYNKDTVHKQDDRYDFFPSDFTQIVESDPGTDISGTMKSTLNQTTMNNVNQCLNNMFYAGRTDFRTTARCQVNNYILLAFTIILCTVIGIKFLAALQLGSKRKPSPQDKFVICQVPA